jgi:hypothetical protein
MYSGKIAVPPGGGGIVYKAVCLHLQIYCEIDVTVVANEVNKFGQIFPIHRR